MQPSPKTLRLGARVAVAVLLGGALAGLGLSKAPASRRSVPPSPSSSVPSISKDGRQVDADDAQAAPVVRNHHPADGLRAEVQSVLDESTSRLPGVAIAVEGFGEALEINGSRPLPPASTVKLLTGAAALLKLGPEFRFRTEVAFSGSLLPDGSLQGSLVLVGGGDPLLFRRHLVELASAVSSAGIKHVAGDLWGDDTRYDKLRYGPGWRRDFVTHESGALSALAVDRNNYRNDAAFIADPVSANLHLFRSALESAGITVAGRTVVGRPEGGLRVVAVRESEALSELVGEMLRESDNFVAEMVLKELGRRVGEPSTQGGVEVLRATALSLGVDPGSLQDGSGLSSGNAQSPHSQVDLLRKLEKTSIGELFRKSLAVSCSQTGTLKKRLCGTAAAGKVYAKTGAIPKSSAMAGFTTTASGREVWFSFMLSDASSTRRAREAIDRALIKIANFQG